MSELKFDFSELWDFIIRYRKILIGAAIVGGIGGYISYKLATPQYQSAAIAYPANDNDNSIQLQQGSIMVVMQILQSSALRNKVIEDFDLYDHYGVDTTNNDYHRKILYDQYHANVDFSVTDFKAIRIMVRDRDPQFAAQMANGIVRIVNEVTESIVKDNSKSILQNIERQLTEKEQQVNILLDSLESMKEKESDPVNILRTQNKYQWNVNYLNQLRSRYEMSKSDLERSVKGLYLISAAEAAVEPSGFGVTLTTLFAMFLTSLCAMGVLLLGYKAGLLS